MSEDETELVQQLRTGDGEAMARFYRCYRRALLAQVRRLVHDPQSAEDVLQEGFLKVWLAVGTYDPARGRLYTWAARICVNAAVDHLRSRAVRQSRRTTPIAALALTGTEPAAPTTFRPEHIGLADLLGRLRPEHRRTLELLYFGGYTYPEVAEEMAVPLSTVKTWASTAKRHLARWM
ncbi:RNA polymerase sigma factor [Hymenobacter coccineus]|uniref:RNA polymerase subunit sigma-70 n=1 Tax=Hymenobacter coccineus TaxID=1908235 RepID=A0A1G1TMQ9_9BACT|nr:RNA polymerase sigma factor [Hymenobacter coccineus]OGX92161.1 hypothetical protein BEN49_03780 [Hymenobacter coccineus]